MGFVVFRELAACISCLLHKIRNGIDIFPDVFSDDLSTAMCTNVTQDLLVIFFRLRVSTNMGKPTDSDSQIWKGVQLPPFE